MVTKTSRVRRLFDSVRSSLVDVKDAVFGFVLSFFTSVNRKIASNFPFQRMEEETSEHVQMLIRVFKFLVFPMSVFYVCLDFALFRENALDSMFWGVLVFFYSSFLPDLPSMFRGSRREGKNGDLPWYKKYFVLLFAPLFVWLLFSGIRIGWRTVESFHNLRSMTVFGVFLVLWGFLAFGGFPIDSGSLVEALSLPLYGLAGYLSHLRVDRIF